MRARRPVVWTGADQADWELLTHEFVVEFFDHVGRCAACGRWPEWSEEHCRALETAWGVLLDWRRKRELASTAARLRAQEDLRGWGVAA